MRSNDGLIGTTLGFSGLTKLICTGHCFSFFIAFKADVKRISDYGTVLYGICFVFKNVTTFVNTSVLAKFA
jgi:hypothetical protein